MTQQKRTIYFKSDKERHAVKAFQEAYREAEKAGNISVLAARQIGSILNIADHRAAADDLAHKII